MFFLAMHSVKEIKSVDFRKNMEKPFFYMPQEIRTQIQKNKTKQSKNAHAEL